MLCPQCLSADQSAYSMMMTTMYYIVDDCVRLEACVVQMLCKCMSLCLCEWLYSYYCLLFAIEVVALCASISCGVSMTVGFHRSDSVFNDAMQQHP